MSDMPKPREQVLYRAFELVGGDRNKTYDEPLANFSRIAALWNAYIAGVADTGRTHLEPHDVAVLNILQKLSRITTSPHLTDNWVDIAGYAACGYECVELTNGLPETDS